MIDTPDPWGLVLILGPLLLLGIIIYAWSRNRAAVKDRGEGALGTTNAVRGSDKARPDIEAEAARARKGDSAGDATVMTTSASGGHGPGAKDTASDNDAGASDASSGGDGGGGGD